MFSAKVKRAILSGNVSKIKALTEGGKYLTAKRERGYTLLHLVALCGNYEVSKTVLKEFKDAVINKGFSSEKLIKFLKNRDGKTPLHLATEKGNVAFIKALKETSRTLWELLRETGDNFGNLPVHTAAAEGQIEVLELFKDQLNEKNEEGNTPLHKAVERNRRESVEFLIKAGAKKDIENDQGLTPEKLSKFYGYGEISDILNRSTEQNKENKTEKDCNLLELLEEIAQWDVQLKADRLVFGTDDGYYKEVLKNSKILWINPDIKRSLTEMVNLTRSRIERIFQKNKLTFEDWEDVTEALNQLLQCLGGEALKGENPEVEEILELISPKLEEAEAIPSELPLVLTLLFPGRFEEIMKEDFNYLYNESGDEDFRKEATRIVRELLIHGKPELAAELYRLPEERIERLPAEILLGGVERIKRIQTIGKPEEIELLRELITEALRELLLSEKRFLEKEVVKRIVHGIVELPLLLEPSKENFEVGLLLKELFFKYSYQITEFFEKDLDPELPENARPQLLYVVRALIRFLEGCGKDFEELYGEFSSIPERYGVDKQEFEKLRSETKTRNIPFE